MLDLQIEKKLVNVNFFIYNKNRIMKYSVKKKSCQQNPKFSALGIDLTLVFSKQRLKKEYFKDRLTKHGTAVVLTKLSKDSSFSLSFRRKFRLHYYLQPNCSLVMQKSTG